MRFGLAVLAILVTWSAAARAGGDPTRGEAVFHQCMICHAVGPNASVRLGPPLNGVVGRAWATRPNYAYSPGLVAGHLAGRTWDEATLDQWLTAPQKLVPNTKMFFGGLPEQQKRQDVIAYLEQFDQNGQKKP
jgi:cytochrome c